MPVLPQKLKLQVTVSACFLNDTYVSPESHLISSPLIVLLFNLIVLKFVGTLAMQSLEFKCKLFLDDQ